MVGASIIRIGFWRVYYTLIIIRSPKPYSNYSGPFINFLNPKIKPLSLTPSDHPVNTYEHPIDKEATRKCVCVCVYIYIYIYICMYIYIYIYVYMYIHTQTI